MLENTTCWFNILYFFIKKKGAVDVVAKAAQSRMPYSGYYDHSPADLARLKQSLHALRSMAPGKKIIVFTIPVATDFKRYGQNRKMPPLVQQLHDFCAAENITYTDLLTTTSPADWQHVKKQFFDTDMHWNEYGNQWAMKKLLPYFTLYK